MLRIANIFITASIKQKTYHHTESSTDKQDLVALVTEPDVPKSHLSNSKGPKLPQINQYNWCLLSIISCSQQFESVESDKSKKCFSLRSKLVVQISRN